MKRGIIIGGGIAGLTAASYLCNSGFFIRLLESSPKTGGRAFSFFDKNLNCNLDNGQHLLMGCYGYTLDFIRLIDAVGNFKVQTKMELNFIDANKKHFSLKASSLPYPFSLLTAILGFKAVPLAERLSAIAFFAKLPLVTGNSIRAMSVREWLKSMAQSDLIISVLWELLAVSALNADIDTASASVFCDILKQIFFHGNSSTRMIIPAKGLSQSFCEPAETFITAKGGEVSLSEKVIRLVVVNNKVTKVITNKNEYSDFDFVVSSAPLYSLKSFLPGYSSCIDSIPELEYSSIFSAHIKIKNNTLTDDFYALIASPLHWVFNHGSYLTVVISNSDSLQNMSKAEMEILVKEEIEKYFGIEKENLSDIKIIKEKRATFIPSQSVIKQRPGFTTNLDNFYLAGDWTSTGLPSTIESAAKSGKIISDYISGVLS